MTVYSMINWFFGFSIFGYLLECVVLSLENRQLVLNRGFVHGPFCIIYGAGAAAACIFLAPIADSTLRLYIFSSLMATGMELVTAHAMIRLFGSFWWDYSRKPLNYRGMICLESSIGWGFLGIIFFRFLNRFMMSAVSLIPQQFERNIAILLVLYYTADFIYCLYDRMKNPPDDDEPVIGRLKVNG